MSSSGRAACFPLTPWSMKIRSHPCGGQLVNLAVVVLALRARSARIRSCHDAPLLRPSDLRKGLFGQLILRRLGETPDLSKLGWSAGSSQRLSRLSFVRRPPRGTRSRADSLPQTLSVRTKFLSRVSLSAKRRGSSMRRFATCMIMLPGQLDRQNQLFIAARPRALLRVTASGAADPPGSTRAGQFALANYLPLVLLGSDLAALSAGSASMTRVEVLHPGLAGRREQLPAATAANGSSRWAGFAVTEVLAAEVVDDATVDGNELHLGAATVTTANTQARLARRVLLPANLAAPAAGLPAPSAVWRLRYLPGSWSRGRTSACGSRCGWGARIPAPARRPGRAARAARGG